VTEPTQLASSHNNESTITHKLDTKDYLLFLTSSSSYLFTMPPLLNNDLITKQVRLDTHSFGASMATTTIHQRDLDRRQKQSARTSAESVRVVSPLGKSNSNHHHHQAPTARSSASKSIVKSPRWTSMHPIPSSNRLKDYRRSKSGMASTLSQNNIMYLPISILKKRKSSPRPAPTPLADKIVCVTAGLLSLRPLHAPITPTMKATTTTSPGPRTTSTNTVTWSDHINTSLDGTGGIVPVSISRSSSCSNSQSSSSLPPEKADVTSTLCSDWDVMFFKHVATPVEDRSPLPADLLAGQVWLH
jgi:hypothetical protein